MTPVTMRDIPKVAHAEPTITIYGPKICPGCKNAMDFFDRAGIAYTKIDIEDDEKAHKYITETLGYREAPVIVVTFDQEDNGRVVHWSKHRMDMLMTLKRLYSRGFDTEAIEQGGVAL